MNVYDFIVKAFGVHVDLRKLNLYIELPEGIGTFQVTKLQSSKLDLLDVDKIYKYLSKGDKFYTTRVSFKKSLSNPRTTLHLNRTRGV